jgi:hypothetical protein
MTERQKRQCRNLAKDFFIPTSTVMSISDTLANRYDNITEQELNILLEQELVSMVEFYSEDHEDDLYYDP